MGRAAGALPVLLAAAASLGFTFLDPAARKNEEGARLYEDGAYAEALKRFQEAQAEAPRSGRLHYNVGSTLYKQEAFGEAEKELMNAGQAGEGDLKARALYNAGNALYRQGRYGEAAEAYKQSLRLDPGDLDAKINLELALKKQQEQENREQDSGGEQDPQGKQQNQDQERDRQQGDDPQSQDRQQDQDPKQQQRQEQDRKQQQDQAQGGRRNQNVGQPQERDAEAGRPTEGLTQEEAERILEALRNRELQAQKHRRVRLKGRPYSGKQW